MKIEYLSNQIVIEPEDIFEENYLKSFVFETTYGEFDSISSVVEDKLIRLIIPKKDIHG